MRTASTVPDSLRVIDSGLARAAEHLATGRAILQAGQYAQLNAGGEPTLRFFRFLPCVLLGLHQSPAQEANEDACVAGGVDIQRRFTGGGSVFMDSGQLGWELCVSQRHLGGLADLQASTRRICGAVCNGLARLGVGAAFRAPADIVVGGRKIAGTSGVVEADRLLFQGSLLIDFDVARMAAVLRIPGGADVGALRQRLVSLTEVLSPLPPLAAIQQALADSMGRDLGLDPAAGALSDAELAAAAVIRAEIDTADWVHAESRPAADMPLLYAQRPVPGGVLGVELAYDRRLDRIRQIRLVCDPQIMPADVLAWLEAAMRNVTLAALRRAIETFQPAGRAALTPCWEREVYAVIAQAVDEGDIHHSAQ